MSCKIVANSIIWKCKIKPMIQVNQENFISFSNLLLYDLIIWFSFFFYDLHGENSPDSVVNAG